MSLTLQPQTSHIGDEPEVNSNVSPRLNPMTRLMMVVVILRLSVFTILLLIGVLVYAVMDAAVRGLILILAVLAFALGLLVYQVVRMITAYAGVRP
jgi:uncharacterized membrane-anchored protein